jgi:hypothetical protein
VTEDGGSELTELCVVLDQQDGLRSTLNTPQPFFRFNSFGRLVDPGKIDLEGCPAIRFAVDPDVASTLFDDSVDGRESEASALADFFSREEGFKDVGRRRAGKTRGESYSSELNCQL